MNPLKTIAAVLEAHPEFKKSGSRHFSGKQLLLGPAWHSQPLLNVAWRRGPSNALDWLFKISTATVTDIRYVAEVYGLKTDERVVLNNGVVLMPFYNLPASHITRRVQNEWRTVPSSFSSLSPPIGAMLEEKGVKSSQTPPKSFSRELERTVTAFTLHEEAAPVIGASWIDFVDPDFMEAEFGAVFLAPMSEGVVPVLAEPIDAAIIEWVNRYTQLKPEVQRICDVALQRLNLARRRRLPGDQAIEGSICLDLFWR